MSKRPAFSEPVMLTSSEEVARYCNSLAQEEFVTIDTEFVRERTYWPQLCLVQLAGVKDVVLIDTCAQGLDLTPLKNLLAKKECLKVFHAARQDLEIFLHIFDEMPVSVFDTQIAAMVAGFGEQVGYDNLVGSLTGCRIDKAHRFSDWAARPLRPAQITYAAADVTYLRLVYQKLHQQLEEQGRLEWVKVEQTSLTDVATYRPDPRNLWRKLKARTNNRRILGILQECAAWREIEAQKLDLPRQRVIRDESLMEIAAVKPKTPQDLARIRGVTNNFAEGNSAQGLLNAINRGEEMDEEDLPISPFKKKPDAKKSPQAVIALLKTLLVLRSEAHHVAARLVASGDELEKLASGETDLPVLKGWRYEIFGQEAQSLLAGEKALMIKNGELHFCDAQQ
ncbi:Ribonuclease D [Aristophania vespae]|nr:ribonuclease D [Aristophania vespae]UMM64319.1 Ribonuclease D [Aristophania vespae]